MVSLALGEVVYFVVDNIQVEGFGGHVAVNMVVYFGQVDIVAEVEDKVVEYFDY